MKKIFGIIFLLLMSVTTVTAADLEASIKLDRMKNGENPLPILVTVKTKTDSIENILKITAGNNWVISGSVNVSLANLPAGVTAWPGMGNSTGVAGQTINFPSQDLTKGTLYGFYIISGIGNNPNIANYAWNVATNSDQMAVNAPIVANDQVTVTGKVGAKATDFQLELSADKLGELSVGDEVIYNIKYGSYLQNSTKPLKITASWSRGTVEGSPLPSVDIVDYVVGSATTGYGGVVPVVDILNRKIEWTINSFPANMTDQMVRFKLTVNNSYSGASRVNFEVDAVLRAANVVTTDAALNHIIRGASVLPTTTPANEQNTTTTVVSLTSTPAPTLTPIEKPKINNIGVAELTDNGIKIIVDNNVAPAGVKIKYGESLNSLNKSITSINGLLSDVINLDGLLEGKDYYFKVEVTAKNGEVVSSDIYTFRTAVKSDLPEIEIPSLLIATDNNIILDSDSTTKEIGSVVLIPHQSYSLRLNLTKSDKVKIIKVYVRNSKVLGMNSVYGFEPNMMTVDLHEIIDGGFAGHLVSPTWKGYYEVVARVEDTSGNIYEKILCQLRVVDSLKVVDENGKPIENARVKVFKYNSDKRLYEPIPSDTMGFKNPSYTETDGKLQFNFPIGKYQVEVGEVGYETRIVDFSVGMGESEEIPEIVLKKTNMGLSGYFSYFGMIFDNFNVFTGNYLDTLVVSVRFFRLITLAVVLSSMVVGWRILRNKLWSKWFIKRGGVYGKVRDEKTKKTIAMAVVYLIDGKNNKILSKVKTDIFGRFAIELKKAVNYKIMAKKDGFETTPMLDYSKEGLTAGEVIIEMENVISEVEEVGMWLSGKLKLAGNFMMILWLIFLLIWEIGFSVQFGLGLTWWPIALAWLNLALWLKN